jgi:hypothetical protein
MAYELTCPSCQARLHLKAGHSGEEALMCPRCLNMVPHPGDAPLPTGAAQAPVTGVTARPGRAVSSVESEVKSSKWTAYFIILALTLLAVVGAVRTDDPNASHPSDRVMSLLIGPVIVLTLLLLYPVGRGLFRATAPKAGAAPDHPVLRTAGIIGLLLILAPVAFFIAFFTVCYASMAHHTG